MTRLKIEVVGEDDAAALHVLKLLYLQMIGRDDSGCAIDDANALVSYAFGNATAEVERDGAKGGE